MIRTYVLVNVDEGTEEEVLRRLRDVPGVVEAHLTDGIYDLILEVVASSREELKEILRSHIRPLEHVRYTVSLDVLEEGQLGRAVPRRASRPNFPQRASTPGAADPSGQRSPRL
ncbi:MAG: Lrp/AsnC family transcriptional regulator [Conexivisphaera sp.]